MEEGRTEILVVDDDADVVDLAVILLSSLGYHVIPARHGEDALAILRESPGIALLMTDIVMPGAMNGLDLADRAKQIRPDLKVIYTSGYAKKLAGDQGTPDHGPLLPKPWRIEQLTDLLRQVLP
jgi:CheY-like chemotaxis protein